MTERLTEDQKAALRAGTPRMRYQVLAADGTILNFSWPTRDRAEQDAERYGDGAYVSESEYVSKPTAQDLVLIEAGVPVSEWSRLRLAANRMLNMTMDAGRPSDAMRSVVRAWEGGQPI